MNLFGNARGDTLRGGSRNFGECGTLYQGSRLGKRSADSRRDSLRSKENLQHRSSSIARPRFHRALTQLSLATFLLHCRIFALIANFIFSPYMRVYYKIIKKQRSHKDRQMYCHYNSKVFCWEENSRCEYSSNVSAFFIRKGYKD